MLHRLHLVAAITALAFVAAPVMAQDAPPATANKEKIAYSPYPGQDFPNRVLFGDTHLHTSYSTDAGMVGCTLTPEDAYRFALGMEVTSSTGVKARLNRPLGINPPLHKRRCDFFVNVRAFTNAKARRLLGYRPRFALPDGVQRTAQWYFKRGLLRNRGSLASRLWATVAGGSGTMLGGFGPLLGEYA
jgi:hypothetical protein